MDLERQKMQMGIAFGKDKAAVFLKGRVIKRVDKNIAAKELKKELERLV